VPPATSNLQLLLIHVFCVRQWNACPDELKLATAKECLVNHEKQKLCVGSCFVVMPDIRIIVMVLV
jgi:hypothetical protein